MRAAFATPGDLPAEAPKARARANPEKRIVALMIFGVAVEAANLVVDTGLWVPRPRSPIAFLAILHFAGVLRGLVVGVLLTLVVLKLLRPNSLNLGDSKV